MSRPIVTPLLLLLAIVITHRLSASIVRSSVHRPYTFLCLHSSIYKYQPISTKLGQNIYDYKYRMCLIMGLIRSEHLELFALRLKYFNISLCLHSSVYRYQPISTNLGQNIHEHKIKGESNYGCNRTGTTGVVCP